MKDGSTATNYVPSKGKLVGQGVVKVDTSTFTGSWNDQGRLEGAGKITIVQNQGQGSFQGTFVDNLRDGQGTYTWPNGQGEYIGLFKDGCRHTGDTGPNATMIWNGEEKHTYVGKFKKGQCTSGTFDGNKVD